jgi:hypothetical protein
VCGVTLLDAESGKNISHRFAPFYTDRKRILASGLPQDLSACSSPAQAGWTDFKNGYEEKKKIYIFIFYLS